MNTDNIAWRVFHGVPRWFGALFNATRAPSIILLIGYVGIPSVLSICLFAYVSLYRSMLPIELFTVGLTQAYIKRDPTVAERLPPRYLTLLETMTPEQQATGRAVFSAFTTFFTLLGLVIFPVMLWWLFRAFKFLAGQADRPRL